MSEQYFHFTLGPVQGFVAQARRTRDFWAGSFILSWLAAVAMKAVHAQYPDKKLEDVILFPVPEPEFMKWLVGNNKPSDKEPPKQGSIPNRFKALVGDNFKSELVTEAVQEAWKALADKVWDRDLNSFGKNSKHYQIWKRQVDAFWDMSWIITNCIEDSSALDRRKNWRTYTPTEEAGVKCFMMDGWQELSGAEKPNRHVMSELLWNRLRSAPLTAIKTDLRQDEALCAIAFIKRRFSRHFSQINHTMQQGWILKGWSLPSNVPSVTYMAVVSWLKELGKSPTLDKKLVKEFYDLAFSLSGGKETEVLTEIACLESLKAQDLCLEGLFSLDGNVFFQTELENPRIFEDTIQGTKTVKALKAMQQSANLKQPSPFYAILLMDGDSLGEKMSNKDFQYPITKGLEEFTNGVPCIVYENNGFLIYAGGDDVLAILPLEDAIPCAVALRKHYMSCFEAKAATNQDKARIAVDTTISAAIEFVHIHTPLTIVLKDSHKLLDEIAKEGSGRDALAVRVWKPGDLQIEWSQPWKIVLDENGNAEVCNLAQEFKENNQKTENFSNKFIYKIRERFDLLNPLKDKEDKYKGFSVFSEEEPAIQLMTMEYMNAYNKKELSYENAKEVVTCLMKQCRPLKRDKNQPTKPEKWLQVDIKNLADSFTKTHAEPDLQKFKIWKVDAALLVRFLAQKGVEHA